MNHVPVKLSDGTVITHLNGRLIKDKQVSQENVEALIGTHITKYFLFQKAEKAVTMHDWKRVRELDVLRREIEFFQQSLWGFNLDSTFHDWWKMPGCTCPKMDNADRKGTPYQIHAVDCPIHGENK